MAVPFLSLISILVEELWVKPMEEADRRRTVEAIAQPAMVKQPGAAEPAEPAEDGEPAEEAEPAEPTGAAQDDAESSTRPAWSSKR